MALNTLSTDVSRILKGSLEDLPPQESKVIRVFLSSTFTDYAEERNLLMREAIPELRAYCEKKGLDFQVADMRWGVRDDAQDDHKTTEICIQEIINCQKFSLGPCFVCLLGNKYGYRPFPSEIEAKEFEILRKAAYTVSKDVTLLTDWFVRDDNAMPPTYVLQPITSKFPFYNDESEENEEKHQKDREDWNAVSGLLAATFRAAANCAEKLGHLSAAEKQKYFMSVTEAEVTKGILSFPEADTRTLSFQRHLNDIDSTSVRAVRYQDLEGGQLDTEAMELLNDLKEFRIPRSLSQDNICKYTIDWTPDGVNPEVTEHAQYLQQMTRDFILKMKEHIDDCLEGTPTSSTLQKDLCQELLHHSHFCVKKCENFCGRQELLDKIKTRVLKHYDVAEKVNELGEKIGMSAAEMKEAAGEIIEDMAEAVEEDPAKKGLQEEIDRHKNMTDSLGVTFSMEQEDMSLEQLHSKELAVGDLLKKGHITKPVVVYGPSGCGKTSLMARIANVCNAWMEKEPVKVVRFLGTSPQSTSIRGVLMSICEQLWEVYDLRKPEIDVGKDFTFLTLYFRALLMKINADEKPLVMILDSVDQLNSDDYAHGMDWLPTLLPPNVHLIVSMVPETNGCLDNTKLLISDTDSFIEVPPLPRETACDILTNWYNSIGRTLTNEQQEYILGALRRCPQPMFLKMAFEQACNWRSYTPQDEWAVGHSVRAAIEQLFQNLERDHGRVLVSRALGYLSVAKNGLSHTEMEDLLSCDDAVLQDTYLYHLPASETLIRLPPLLWRRIIYDLREYVVQRQAGGKDIITWYHRQFLETALNRYTTPRTKTKLHRAIAEYFSGKWSAEVKPLELYKRKKGSYPQALRGVPPQPIHFCPTVYNLRKLDELPFHLIHSGRFMELLTEVFQNLEWLVTKSKAMNINEVMNDIKQTLLRLKCRLQKPEEPRSAQNAGGHFDEKQKEESAEKAQSVADEDNMEKNIAKKLNGESSDTYITELVHNEGSLQEEEFEEEEEEAEEEENEETLKVVAKDMKLIHKMLMLASDAVRKDVSNLPIQIIGQLSRIEEVPAGLLRLLEAAQSWVKQTQKPLLVPQTACLPRPGRDLLTSVDLALYYPGDAYQFERKLCLSKDSKVLYGIERTSGSDGDNLRQFDLENTAATMKLLQLHKSVKWIDLVADDRYLVLHIYTQRDNFHPKYQPVVIDQNQHRPVVFPNFAEPMCFSKTGRYCVLATKKEFTIKRDPFLAPSEKGSTDGKGDHIDNDNDGDDDDEGHGDGDGPRDEHGDDHGDEHGDGDVHGDAKNVDKKSEHENSGDNEEEKAGGDADGDSGEEEKEKKMTKKEAPEKDTNPFLELGILYDLETQTSKPLKVASKVKNMCSMKHALFSPDEKYVVLSCEDGSQYAFSVAKGKWCGTSREQDNFLLGFQDERHSLREAVHILPNNLLLTRGLSHQTEKNLYLRDLGDNMKVAAEFSGHVYSVSMVELNDSKTLAASATADSIVINGVNTKYVYVWDLEKMERHSVCKGSGPYSSITFGGAHDDYVLTNGFRDSNIVVWYIGSREEPCAEGVPIYNIIGHTKEVIYMQMTCNSQLLITGSLDNTVKCWSFPSIVEQCKEKLAAVDDLDVLREEMCRELDRPYKPGEGKIVTTATTVSKNGKVAAVGTADGWVIFYDLGTISQMRCEKVSDKKVVSMLTTKSGKYIVSAADNIKVWDPNTGECVEELAGKKESVACLAESNDILVAGYGGMECYGYLWNLTTGEKLQVLQGLYGFNQVVISSDASKVVTTFFDFPMVFDVATGQPTDQNMQQADTMMSGCSCLRLSPDDKLVVSCSVDGSVRVSEINTSTYKFRMQHRSSVPEATFTQDSQLLVTAGFKNILVWSMANGSLLQTLSRHTDFITRLKFVVDDRYLVSCAFDKQIVVWDFKNHCSVASYQAHCPLPDVSIAEDLSSILYAPENVAYLGVLKPNKTLCNIVKGEEKEEVPDALVKAQAFAFAFSPQKAKQTTSRSCNIL